MFGVVTMFWEYNDHGMALAACNSYGSDIIRTTVNYHSISEDLTKLVQKPERNLLYYYYIVIVFVVQHFVNTILITSQCCMHFSHLEAAQSTTVSAGQKTVPERTERFHVLHNNKILNCLRALRAACCVPGGRGLL